MNLPMRVFIYWFERWRGKEKKRIRKIRCTKDFELKE